MARKEGLDFCGEGWRADGGKGRCVVFGWEAVET